MATVSPNTNVVHATPSTWLPQEISKMLCASHGQQWNKQHRSTQATDIIEEKLGCQLPVPILTRWNSTYHAMEHLNSCVLTKQQDLHEACERLQVARFKATQLTFIKEYVQVNM